MVEIDPELIQVIRQNPLLSPFEIFNQDILKTNLQELGLNNPKVIGNIPYNITSPIIFWPKYNGRSNIIWNISNDLWII